MLFYRAGPGRSDCVRDDNEQCQCDRRDCVRYLWCIQPVLLFFRTGGIIYVLEKIEFFCIGIDRCQCQAYLYAVFLNIFGVEFDLS